MAEEDAGLKPLDCHRCFLGWNEPGLKLAATEIVRRFRSANSLDLSRIWLVVPGKRAGRRLLEILVDQAEAEHLALSPPLVLTEGPLADRLAPNPLPTASPALQLLAWLESLRTADADMRAAFLPSPPAAHDLDGWLAIAWKLDKLHRELAAADLCFADVAARAADTIGPFECRRWTSLAGIQARYLAGLAKLGFADPEQNRRDAVAHGAKLPSDDAPQAMVLIGVLDLPWTTRRLIAAGDAPLHSLIHAPVELEAGFDELGCLRAPFWSSRPVELPDAALVEADGPQDQAAAIMEFLGAHAAGLTTEQITIGADDTDEDVVAAIRSRFAANGITLRTASGIPTSRTRPYRLLNGVLELLTSRRFRQLADLIRDPDFSDALVAVAETVGRGRKLRDPLVAFDCYWGNHLPATVSDNLARSGVKDNSAERLVADTWAAAANLLEPLLPTGPDYRRHLSQWAEPIRDLLLATFGRASLNPEDEPERVVLEACEALHAGLVQLHSLPPELDAEATAAEALHLTLELASTAIAEPQADAAIEVLGWLELRLDDAPALAVTSFNDGRIPESVNADAFLPNGLRRQLGLMDNDRRFARDAYAVQALAMSRPKLALIVARRNGENDRLKPSRLLFACEPEKLVGRVRRFFSDAAPVRTFVLPNTAVSLRENDTMGKPAFADIDPTKKLDRSVIAVAVTGFRSYLACPFRFYLGSVLRRHAMSDDGTEMDPMIFGSMAHAVLHDFGADEVLRDSTDVAAIQKGLKDALDRHVAAAFSGNAVPAVWVQIEQLKERFDAFAFEQAKQVEAGWRIRLVEVNAWTPLEINGRKLRIEGRIDRIDQHVESKEIRVWDYKTSEKSAKPEEAHRKKASEWIDLQLPLYRFLLQNLTTAALEPSPTLPAVGYINLPAALKETAFVLAEWSDDDFAAAFAEAGRILTLINQGVFWPPNNVRGLYDDFEVICRLT